MISKQAASLRDRGQVRLATGWYVVKRKLRYQLEGPFNVGFFLLRSMTPVGAIYEARGIMRQEAEKSNARR